QLFPGQLYPWPSYLYPFEMKTKHIVFAFSFDPNVIYGPVGVGEEQYVRSKDKQFFGVSFENLPEATAAAQVVEVRDTLDLNVFDATTFEFADVMVAGHSIRVPRGRHEFALDFYPVENVPYKVRLNGDFNDETGVIRWILTTLDTLTESLPDFDGFLPPNMISPEGEGTVYYSVSPRTDLESGTEMNSEATIYFDLNEPITTNTWTNTVDDEAPTSFLTASLVDNTNISIQMNGTDDGCGIARYNIFISYNGGDFELFTTSSGGNVELIGEPSIVYGLYCEAVDSLGNGEVKEPIAEVEITTGIEEFKTPLAVFSVYPNPNNGEFNILPSSALQKSKLLVYDNTGALVHEQRVSATLGESIRLDLRDLPSGQYVVRLQTSKGSFAAQRMVTVD
ncbi:MAG: T9SS type A sorting domain-containing protein, partial [Flavobacteriales bacterium]